ncbi:MAG: hypothetical protein N2589_04095 [bacterium]|nr:hypothetical protein [bacterium]
MKKIMLSVLLGTLLLGITYSVYSQERRGPGGIPGGQGFTGERREGPFAEAGEIRRKMREIEIQTIQSDPELKKLQEQITSLQRQLEEKLQQKLSTNQEYQTLKKKMEDMRKEWEERRKEREGQK